MSVPMDLDRPQMSLLLSPRAWFALSLIWVLDIVARCWSLWPRLPLDVSASDPATQAAFHQAVASHVMMHGAFALAPPVILLIFGRMLRGRGRLPQQP